MTVVGHHEIQISYCKALDTYTVINSKLQNPPSPPLLGNPQAFEHLLCLVGGEFEPCLDGVGNLNK